MQATYRLVTPQVGYIPRVHTITFNRLQFSLPYQCRWPKCCPGHFTFLCCLEMSSSPLNQRWFTGVSFFISKNKLEQKLFFNQATSQEKRSCYLAHALCKQARLCKVAFIVHSAWFDRKLWMGIESRCMYVRCCFVLYHILSYLYHAPYWSQTDYSEFANILPGTEYIPRICKVWLPEL